MLMKYTDLEPGDVVRYSKDVIKHFERNYYDWANEKRNKIFEVKSVVNHEYYISIALSAGGGYLDLNSDGSAYIDFSGFDGPILEIVSLKE